MRHNHDLDVRCTFCVGYPEYALEQILLLEQLEITMTEFASDQAHLDADVQAETTAFGTVIAELKAQQAAGQPLDFTKADAFVAAVQTEATTDAPAAPADPSAPVADPNAPVTPVDDGTAPTA